MRFDCLAEVSPVTVVMFDVSVVLSGAGSRRASLFGGTTLASEGCCAWAVDCGAVEASSTAMAAVAKNAREYESKLLNVISVSLRVSLARPFYPFGQNREDAHSPAVQPTPSVAW